MALVDFLGSLDNFRIPFRSKRPWRKIWENRRDAVKSDWRANGLGKPSICDAVEKGVEEPVMNRKSYGVGKWRQEGYR